MKNVIIISCLVLVGNITIAQAQSAKPPAFDPLMNKLLTVKWISNHDPGFGGGNEFYKLSKELLSSHDRSDFSRMVNHRNPIVRAMGLLCLTQTASDENVLLLLSHWKDDEMVYLNQGCIVSKITIGEFAQRLLRNPHFLDP
jgi:hypothetical protein